MDEGWKTGMTIRKDPRKSGRRREGERVREGRQGRKGRKYARKEGRDREGRRMRTREGRM